MTTDTKFEEIQKKTTMKLDRTELVEKFQLTLDEIYDIVVDAKIEKLIGKIEAYEYFDFDNFNITIKYSLFILNHPDGIIKIPNTKFYRKCSEISCIDCQFSCTDIFDAIARNHVACLEQIVSAKKYLCRYCMRGIYSCECRYNLDLELEEKTLDALLQTVEKTIHYTKFNRTILTFIQDYRSINFEKNLQYIVNNYSRMSKFFITECENATSNQILLKILRDAKNKLS